MKYPKNRHLDFLNRLKEASNRGLANFNVHEDFLTNEILNILWGQGLIEGYTHDNKTKTYNIFLRYENNNQIIPLIKDIKIISKPSKKVFMKKWELNPINLNKKPGFGILTTHNGVLSSSEAWEKGIGGLMICWIYF